MKREKFVLEDKIDMLEFENKYEKEGFFRIIGVDEAGRGPLAGPVAVAGVIMDLNNIIDGVNDSKKLSEKKREELFPKIIENAIAYEIVEIDEKIIDEINILNATKLGMKKVIEALNGDIALVDAVDKIDVETKIVPLIKGDLRSYSIACASILAKVHRDHLMLEMAKEYPEYGFEKHKGYGTKVHIEKLKEYGPCKIHRRSFIGKFIQK